MRGLALLFLFAVAGCREEPAVEPQAQAVEIWRNGRDGLCLAGDGTRLRAGLIVYGAGDTNCSLAGAAVREGSRLVITPRGDPACRVEVTLDRDQALLGGRSPACAYYCGPAADFAGRTLDRSEAGAAVTDFAGDPLC